MPGLRSCRVLLFLFLFGPLEELSPMRPYEEAMSDLGSLLPLIWSNLEEAASGARHGWHLPMIATGGTQPHVRTVVLRSASTADRTLGCHTDVRSPKVTQLRVTPHACWCFYDKDNRVQLVADGTASVHTDDDVAEAGWDRSSASSRRCYLAPAAPGETLSEPKANLPDEWIGTVPPLDATAPGREHFAVVQTRVQRLDFLYLAHSGNLRAEFLFDGTGTLSEARWIAA